MIDYQDISYTSYVFDNIDKSKAWRVMYSDGTIWYVVNKSTHRENGPAIIQSNGHLGYFYYGIRYGNHKDYTNEQWIRFCKLKAFI